MFFGDRCFWNERTVEILRGSNKTKEILIDLGYDKNEIENLRKERVIFFNNDGD